MRNYLTIFIILIHSVGAGAQAVSDSALVHKDYQQNSYWLTLRADAYLKSGSYFFFEGNLKTKNSFSSLNEYNNRHFMLGYELKASYKWYFGLSVRNLSSRYMNYFVPKVNLTHRGSIKKINFIKELSAEDLLLKKYYSSNLIRLGLSAGLGKNFKIGKTNWYGMMSYRVFLIYDLKNGKNSYLANRKIDLTRLRFDLHYIIIPNLYIGVFAMRETEYLYVLGYSQNGINYPDMKENRVAPTFGLTLNYIFKPENNSSIIPGLPYR
jgi:hypothetical protein